MQEKLAMVPRLTHAVTIGQSEENELWNHAWAETNDSKSPPFNFLLVDGDYYAALPCISLQGKFAVEGSDYTEYVNVEATEKAYRLARQARFEHR